MMNRCTLTLVFLFITIPSFCQVNLVRNPSFEQHDTCPDDYDQVRKSHFWDGIDTNYVYMDSAFVFGYHNFLPDYMNACDTGGICGIPHSPYFYHYARTGNAMMESAMYYDLSYIHTSGAYEYNYTQGRLINYLVAGKTYCVTFYVCQEHGSGYSINKIGAYLDDGRIDTANTPLKAAKPQTQYTPQVLETAVIYDTLNWTKIQGSFIANGNEKYITIGVFFDTAHHLHIPNGFMMGGQQYGAYLIDDVSVIASDAVAYAGHDTTSMHPGDTVRLGLNEDGDGMPCWWYKLGVAAPIDSGGTIYVHPDSTTTYVVMMDLCGTITYDTVTVWVGRVSVNNLQFTAGNLRVYPNPAMNEITIEGAKDCEIVFFDIVGRLISRFDMSSAKENIDVAMLKSGIYSLQITDRYTGEKAVSKFVKE